MGACREAVRGIRRNAMNVFGEVSLSTVALSTLLSVLIAMSIVDAFIRIRVRYYQRRLARARKCLARTGVWYAQSPTPCHVWLVKMEAPAGTFVGWLDTHPYQPTNQPPRKDQESQ